MSDLPADDRGRLDLAELVARIERQQEETRKFVAEQHKLGAEQLKLAAEQNKLAAEALKLGAEGRKFERDRGLAPWQALVLAAGGIGGLLAAIISIAHTLGWLR